MRKLAFLVAAAAAFGAAPFAGKLGLAGGPLVLVALGVVLGLAASGTVSALAMAGGALGAFASGVLSTASPAVGGAALLALAYGERSWRVRGRTARAAHLGLALVGGALSGALSGAFLSASPAVRGVATVVAAVLAALPLLVDADDPIAHALDGAASDLEGPVAASLREGAELRRTTHEVPLDRPTTARVRSTWRALLQLAEVRSRLERTKSARTASSPAHAVVEMLDQRIRDHVVALSRAYTAADSAKAAEVGLDDSALRSVETMGDSLEDVSRALVEVRS
jgi:MFS family permease